MLVGIVFFLLINQFTIFGLLRHIKFQRIILKIFYCSNCTKNLNMLIKHLSNGSNNVSITGRIISSTSICTSKNGLEYFYFNIFDGHHIMRIERRIAGFEETLYQNSKIMKVVNVSGLTIKNSM